MRKHIKSTITITLITVGLLVLVDQLLGFFNVITLGTFNISSVVRSPRPYIEFAGAPNALDHNKFGYRWTIADNPGSEPFKIAFFGGSTGYGGEPPIATLLERHLQSEFGRPIKVANFSVVSSNHRQHIHNIIESNKAFKPDVIVFYGGFNETAQTAFYDPRPGYPYNFFFRAETSSWRKVLYEISPTIRVVNRIAAKHGLFDLTPLTRLRSEFQPYSDSWKASVHDNYFETLSYANTLAAAFATSRCSPDAKFRAFYQPYQIPENLKSLDVEIRKTLKATPYVYDVSDLFQGREHLFTDIVHVTQEGNELMARKLFDLLKADQAFSACIKQN